MNSIIFPSLKGYVEVRHIFPTLVSVDYRHIAIKEEALSKARN